MQALLARPKRYENLSASHVAMPCALPGRDLAARAAFWLPGPELCRRSGVKGAAAVGIAERRGLDRGFADDVL